MPADALATLGASASSGMVLPPKPGIFRLQHQESYDVFRLDILYYKYQYLCFTRPGIIHISSRHLVSRLYSKITEVRSMVLTDDKISSLSVEYLTLVANIGAYTESRFMPVTVWTIPPLWRCLKSMTQWIGNKSFDILHKRAITSMIYVEIHNTVEKYVMGKRDLSLIWVLNMIVLARFGVVN